MGMQINIETVLGEDKTFWTTQQSASGTIRTWGTYKVVNGNAIEYHNEHHTPDVQTVMGPNGWVTVPFTVNDKDTSYFRFVDENTIFTESSVPGIAPVTFTRGMSFAAPADLGGNQLFQAPILGAPSLLPSNTNQSLFSGKLTLYIFLGFVLFSSLLAFCSLPSMP